MVWGIPLARLLIFVILATCTLISSAQDCVGVPARGGGYKCKNEKAKCSPVTEGSGNSGTCRTSGGESEYACDCVGKALPPPTVKPSDVFFYPPGSSGTASNNKPAASIVAQPMTVRGWLTTACPSCQDYKGDGFTTAAFANENYHCGVHFGFEDVLYNLVLDYDFIANTYGANPDYFAAAQLHGNPIDSKTASIPFQDTEPVPGGARTGVDVNSFWLPYLYPSPDLYTSPVGLHLELNAWHTRDSGGCPLVNTCDCHTYSGRGGAPALWREKEYACAQPGAVPGSCTPPNTASDNWWPFDPDNPDGQVDSNHQPRYLQIGDYVEVQGTLWQDSQHPEDNNCWGKIFHNHDGKLEIHPIDSLKLVAPRDATHSPQDDTRNSAIAGVKRAIPVAFCSDDTGAPNAVVMSVCPEQTYTGGIPEGRKALSLVPHALPIVDGRFSNLAGGTGLLHPDPIVIGDCVRITASSPAGLRWAAFKATYVVWWTQPSRSRPR